MSSTIFSTIASSLSGPSTSMILLLVKATLILLVAIGITLTMQRTSAGARHLVWLVSLSGLLLVPALAAWSPISLRILPPESAATTRQAPAISSASLVLRAGSDQSATIAPSGAAAADANYSAPVASTESASRSPLLSGLSIAFVVWAAVMLVIAAWLGYAAMLVKRIVNRSRPLDTEDWLNPLWEVSDRLSLEEPPRLLRSEDAKMPFACGLFTPTIVLPAECDAWSLDRRRAVLLHELAHVRRHDLVGHTLGRLACAFYWFHPLVWTAAKQLRAESERACDDLALACGARATDYAEHLLDIVTSVRRDATPSVALAMARRKEFEGRMLAILDPELRHVSPSRKQSLGLIASLAMIAIVVGAAAPAPRAAVSQKPEVAAAPAASDSIELATSQKLPDAKGYPDSREIIDGSKTHQSLQTSTIQRTVQRTLTNTLQKTVPDYLQGVIEQASTAVKPAVIMDALTKGSSKAQRDTDERPVLLARILATDTSAELRRIAAWGLAEYADEQVAVDALANALRRDSNADVREMAAWALAEGERSSVGEQALAAALRGDASTDVRARAAWALGSVGDRSSADALAAALSDKSVEVRKRAAWALGNADLRQAPPALINLLNDQDPEMRELAAWALFQIEDPAAIPGLEAALKREQDKDLQVAYIRALAAVGEKSVDALKSLLESKDQDIRTIAVRALAGGHATGPWPRPWPEPRPFPN
ncbi:MAG TPA: HEAT repeat domain-containing protein [Gemmatimonadaceae bacterium]|nr:HEAT repeat domain-containing protein [Gemmatimonadaceae bacterium]